MANKSVFPATIQFDGAIWHMVYDPNCEATVMPNINDSDVRRTTCDVVRFPGRDVPIWLLMVDIAIPSRRDSSGRIIGARRLLGFRTFDHQPASSYRIQPNELVYYVAEQSDSSAAQQFFNAITGVSEQGTVAQPKPDTSWCQQFAQEEAEIVPMQQQGEKTE